MDFVPRYMPRPYSALSSNREFAHAGPCPCAFVVYGIAGALAPQMEEQPVAFEISIRSPKSCVTSFAYGVSPQPAHAPENSKSGFSNCDPMIVVFFIGVFLIETFSTSTPKSKYFCASRSLSSSSVISSALPGQTCAQLPQPRQSSVETAIVKLRFCALPGFDLMDSNPSGAAASSSSVVSTGRMEACGQTSEHWLHWMHFSLFQTGTEIAVPRFSYAVPPSGNVPSSMPARSETLSLSPS